jgi:hypothetical protein
MSKLSVYNRLSRIHFHKSPPSPRATMGGLNVIAEVIFVPIVVLGIVGFVVFKRKRKHAAQQNDIKLQQQSGEWNPNMTRTELQAPQPVYGGPQQHGPMHIPPQYRNDQYNGPVPVYHGTQQQQNSNIRPWDQGPAITQIYRPPPEPIVHGYQQQYYQQNQI